MVVEDFREALGLDETEGERETCDDADDEDD